ncbi:hypothetical protein F5X68DRAFT_46489 [Plectosphaerella plurivora]|uniref:Uncharacterized protein n=1 Tax=Plectosphaerella plurivora TaxID=936078 RepID=A0A9P8VJX0_9PEZI|nr:hypothetical protein F5X68DRAFT_46489 [Plectosphaerella plurivora]
MLASKCGRQTKHVLSRYNERHRMGERRMRDSCVPKSEQHVGPMGARVLHAIDCSEAWRRDVEAMAAIRRESGVTEVAADSAWVPICTEVPRQYRRRRRSRPRTVASATSLKAHHVMANDRMGGLHDADASFQAITTALLQPPAHHGARDGTVGCLRRRRRKLTGARQSAWTGPGWSRLMERAPVAVCPGGSASDEEMACLRGRNVLMVVDEVNGRRGSDGSLVRKKWSDDDVVKSSRRPRDLNGISSASLISLAGWQQLP